MRDDIHQMELRGFSGRPGGWWEKCGGLGSFRRRASGTGPRQAGIANVLFTLVERDVVALDRSRLAGKPRFLDVLGEAPGR